ncbi:hypothetical protein B4065_0172 [Caldibacillus thermoamylovorans]|uniref:hypothetical protein n=1 Tax=Caldibacillus thermoamylovorans TaxID=35841 RepID=UPI0005A43FA0|nr:hypothetical protein [Caldibacillus thermoamylovorans]KIO60246.1 hypothetical protein B4065_0172 [Caldibacillus thermoamylovorans]
MNVQITNINISYNEGKINTVQVYFSGATENHEINISGYVPLTAEEYQGNESIEVLTGIVKQTIIDKLTV